MRRDVGALACCLAGALVAAGSVPWFRPRGTPLPLALQAEATWGSPGGGAGSSLGLRPVTLSVVGLLLEGVSLGGWSHNWSPNFCPPQAWVKVETVRPRRQRSACESKPVKYSSSQRIRARFSCGAGVLCALMSSHAAPAVRRTRCDVTVGYLSRFRKETYRRSLVPMAPSAQEWTPRG